MQYVDLAKQEKAERSVFTLSRLNLGQSWDPAPLNTRANYNNLRVYYLQIRTRPCFQALLLDIELLVPYSSTAVD